MHPSSVANASPLINIAAIAVVVASLAAIGAIFGVIPTARSERQEAPSPPPSAKIAAAAPQDVARGAESRLSEVPAADVSSHMAQSTADGCANCGVVEAVRAIQVPGGQATGVGAVAGGLTGAVVGSQLGRGNGRTALGILGAVGGAYAGHAIERNARSHMSYRVTVRMQDGSKRTVYSAAAPEFAIGEKVRVVNGTLSAQG